MGVGLPGDLAAGVSSIGGMRWEHLSVAGMAICVVGVVGDLWESLLKRTAMVKVREYVCPFDCREFVSSLLQGQTEPVLCVCVCYRGHFVCYVCEFNSSTCATSFFFVRFRVSVA